MAVTDKQIRQAIASVLTDALKTHYGISSGDPLHVRVHDHWVLSFAVNETANMLKVNLANHAERGKIHGWMIGIDSVTRARPNVEGDSPQGRQRIKDTNPNRRDILRSYKIWCYHSLEEGTLGQETETNSENILTAEIEAVADAFSNNPSLGINDASFLGHYELQFRKIDTYKFGESQANVAQGFLEVRLRKPIRPQE